MAFAWSLHSMSKETYFIYAAQALIFFGAYLAWQLFRRKWANETLRILFLVGLVVTVFGSGMGMVSYFHGRAAGEGASPEALAPLDPEAAGAPTGGLPSRAPLGGGDGRRRRG